MNIQTEIEVHPLAKVYRLYIAEEMEDLIASIKKNGLRDPIMLDEQGRLIDGRNRLKACREAGVEPRFETFKGDEEAIADYIYDKNSVRRDLTSGQKAMAYVILFPEEPENKGGRGKATINRNTGVTVSPTEKQRIFEARTIKKYSEAEIENVILGVTPFKNAYEKAAQRKREDEPDSEKRKDRRLAAVAAADPDLAGQVQKNLKTIEDAEKELQARAEVEAARRRNATIMMHTALSTFNTRAADPVEFANKFHKDIDPAFWPPVALADYNAEGLSTAITVLETLRDLLKQQEEGHG